ncbi:MAG: group II truncated hemoglobin [Gammaproteobacteria bacterium]|nr:group II truncated hemoglobin [Gammaproteobacteria bacterium]
MKPAYGQGNASFQAAGGETGIFRLVNDFFDRMSSDKRFATIWHMHPDDKDMSRDKLARFLCGWLGGPKLYNEKYGAIGIPRVHAHLAIESDERDQWLSCMSESVAQQPYADEFKVYLMEQLFVPAEAVRRRVEKERSQ